MKFIRYFILLIGITLFSVTAPLSVAFSADVTDWQWVKNTYWYVPKTNLPAFRFNASNGTISPVSDQTVFYISDYIDGYFWGKTVVKLGQSSAKCMSLVGSVTPEGSVLLAFTPADATADSAVTQGIGRMIQKAGQWTMQNQMSSGSALLQVSHWAYMAQTSPGKQSWLSLPGVGQSVEAFLAQCPDGPQ